MGLTSGAHYQGKRELVGRETGLTAAGLVRVGPTSRRLGVAEPTP